MVVWFHLLFLPAAGRFKSGTYGGGASSYNILVADSNTRIWGSDVVFFSKEISPHIRGAVRLASVVSEVLTRQGNASYIFRP